MPQAPYIPPKDADFDVWLLNFTTQLTADPTDFGLVAGDAVICAAQYTAWHAAYLTATNPATRTSPAVAAKDAARVTAEAVIRPYAISIRNNSAVSDALKLDIGVNLPNTAPTPIPAPTTAPALTFVGAIALTHRLAYRDSEAISGKKKPYGVIGMELWRAIGTVPAVSPEACDYYAQWTKSPNQVTFDGADVGKIATYYARWITRSGPAGNAQVGPWSSQLVAAII